MVPKNLGGGGEYITHNLSQLKGKEIKEHLKFYPPRGYKYDFEKEGRGNMIFDVNKDPREGVLQFLKYRFCDREKEHFKPPAFSSIAHLLQRIDKGFGTHHHCRPFCLKIIRKFSRLTSRLHW